MKSKTTMTCIVISAAMLASTVGAATLSVGVGQTYETITNAFANAVESDIIEIHEGTYTEFPSSFASPGPSKNITFQRHGDDKVVIAAGERIYPRNRSTYTFRGLIFDDSNFNITGTGSFYIYLRDNAHYMKFYDCVFYTPGSTAFYKYQWNVGTVIDKCTFYNCEQAFRVNYAGSGWGTTITDTLFVDNLEAIVINTTDTNAPLTTYCAYWNNATLISEGYSLGSGCVSNVAPVFASTDLASPNFMYLSHRCPLAIAEGGSSGQAIGARPALQFRGTVIMVN